MLKMFKLQIISDGNINKKYFIKFTLGYLMLTHNENLKEIRFVL